MVIIVGSRRDGNSLKLAKFIKEEMEKVGESTSIIVPGNQRIRLCTGCMDCYESGVCDFKDDMGKNIDLLKNEDVIMFITPTRFNLLSGDMKIFMDRLNPMYPAKSLMSKKGIIVSIGSSAKDEYSPFEATQSVRCFLEAMNMECALTKEFYDCLNDDDIFKKNDEVFELVKNIKEIIKNN